MYTALGHMTLHDTTHYVTTLSLSKESSMSDNQEKKTDRHRMAISQVLV